MILAQELRINNLVMVNGEIEEIFGICEDYPFLKTAKYGACVIEYKDLEPITLTEEWLIGFGCEVYEFDHKENQYRIAERLIVIRDGFFYEYGTSIKLQYVHTFQNLIFALTQQELKLN